MAIGKPWVSLLSLVFGFVYFSRDVEGFSCPNLFLCNIKPTAKTSMSMNKVPGSFFNPVPENEDSNNESSGEENKEVSDTADGFEASISELMKKRTEKPRAATPSTINGKPTAKGKCFSCLRHCIV